jgi:ubiquitin carboxyl-terminal hydrolase 34
MEFTLVFWPLISKLVPEAIGHPQQCDELFSLCHALFKRLGETSLDSVSLENLLREWASLLLSHTPVEVLQVQLSRYAVLTHPQRVDHPDTIDLVIQGLANLCHCAVTFAKINQQPLTCR